MAWVWFTSGFMLPLEMHNSVFTFTFQGHMKVVLTNEWFIVVCSGCRQNLKFVDFTLLF